MTNFLAGAEGGDGVSHLAHLFGALVGATFGFLLHHPDKKKTWWEKIKQRTAWQAVFSSKRR